MNQEKLNKLFELCEELYQEEQKKSGMISPIPYCFAKHNKTKALIVFSSFGFYSNKIQELLMPKDKEWHLNLD